VRGTILWVVAFALVAACGTGTHAADSEGSAALWYSGPILGPDGRPRDYTAGISEDEEHQALVIAAEGTHVGPGTAIEVADLARGDLGDLCPASSCITVTLIEYTSGQTIQRYVDLGSEEVAREEVVESTLGPVGEEAARRLYGLALADEGLRAAIGGSLMVDGDVTSFTLPDSSCEGSRRPQHRCVASAIEGSAGTAYVFGDLTDETVLEWHLETAP
jgi:hypothetical protein